MGTVPTNTTRLPHTESNLRTTIFTAVGEASTCWENLSGAGVFDDQHACAVGTKLMEDVLRITELGEPRLGCATTKQLLDELSARLQVGAKGLDYRPVED